MDCFRLPSGEYRFMSSVVVCPPKKALYIDPSTWCIDGQYDEDHNKILTRTKIVASLIGLTPFTVAWIADTHMTDEREERILELSRKLKVINPTLSLIVGDVVNGSGEYRGSSMSDKWFENTWDSFKTVPNHLWVKGNHDVDPGHYEFYNWSERLWSLSIGQFKLIAFDTFNEGRAIPRTSHTFISLSDTIWLRRRLTEDDRVKVILAHHLFSQWRIFAYLALKDAVNLRQVFAGHDHKAYIEKVGGLVALVNGTAAPEADEHYISVSTFHKNGAIDTVLVKDVKVGSNEESWNIRPDFDEFYGRPIVPLRISRKVKNRWINVYVMVDKDGKAELNFKGYSISSTAELYIMGEGIKVEGGELYDSWTGLNGRTWKAYRLPKGVRGKVSS